MRPTARLLLASLFAAGLPVPLATTNAWASTPPAPVQSAATSTTATIAWTTPASASPITRYAVRRNGILTAAGYKWGANNATHTFFTCGDPAEQAATAWPNCPSGGKVYTVTMWGGYGASYEYLQGLFS